MRCNIKSVNTHIDHKTATLKHFPVMCFSWKCEVFSYCSACAAVCGLHISLYIHTCNNLYLYTLVSGFHRWNWAVYETALYTVTPSPITQTHTWMQMCLLAMKKLSVLICSLRPEDRSDHGDGGCSPHSPRLVATGPAGAQVALEGAPFSQQAADAALDRALCPPNVPDARRPDTLLLEWH